METTSVTIAMEQHERTFQRLIESQRHNRLVSALYALMFRFRSSYRRNMKHKISDDRYEME